MSQAAALPGPFAKHLRRRAWVLPLVALAALLALAINEMAYHRSSAALERLGERSVARLQIHAVFRGLLDAETGQRGYLLTTRQVYLEPYHRSLAVVPDTVAWLGRYYQGDAAVTSTLGEISADVEAKLSELSTTLDMHAQGRNQAWREILLTDIGRERMDHLRDAGERLLALELQRFEAERRQVFDTLRVSRIGVALMVALSLLALAMFLRQTMALDAAQRGHARALQAERDHLEAEVTSRTSELTQLAEGLQTAREDERSRIARELHDELGALLTAAKLDAARLKRSLAEVHNAEIDERLAHLVGTLNDGIGLKRRIIEDLRPSSLSNLGLKAALEILAVEFGERAGLKVSAQIADLELDDAAEITLYRMVQESLTNVAKYAGAREVRIALEREGEQISASVADDGKGFDAGRVRGSAQGLVGMRYRVQARGGRLSVSSSPGRGTTIRALLPLNAPLPAPLPAV